MWIHQAKKKKSAAKEDEEEEPLGSRIYAVRVLESGIGGSTFWIFPGFRALRSRGLDALLGYGF